MYVCISLYMQTHNTHTHEGSGYINRNSVPQCFKKLFALLLKQLFRRIVSTALKEIHIEETRDQTLFHSVISFRKEFPHTRNSHICITVRILNRIYSHSTAKISCTYLLLDQAYLHFQQFSLFFPSSFSSTPPPTDHQFFYSFFLIFYISSCIKTFITFILKTSQL